MRRYGVGGKVAELKSPGEPTEADLKAQGMPTFSDPPPPVSEPPGALQSLFSNGVNFIRGLDRGFSQNIGAMAGSSPLDLVKNIGSGLIEPFRVVHDTATGKMDPRDMGPGTDRAIGMGIDIGTAAAGLPGEPGALGMFAGRKSATFPRESLRDVLRRGDVGQAPNDALEREIWNKHGIGFTRDTRAPFYEIDDSASVYKGQPQPPNRPYRADFPDLQSYQDAFLKWEAARKAQMTGGGALTVKDILDHPELYKAYPDLGDVPVTFDHRMQGGEKGYYDRGANRIGLNPSMSPEEQHSVLLHELQHGVQQREGWQGGANTETGNSIANQARVDMNAAEGMIEFFDLLKNGTSERKIRNMMANGKVTGGERELKMAKDILAQPDGEAIANGVYQEMLRRMHDRGHPFKNYQRVEGEVQARNTQQRRMERPTMRRNLYWKDTEDYQGEPRFMPNGGSADDLSYSIGKPDTVNIPGEGKVPAEPLPEAMDAADSYMRARGINEPKIPERYPDFDEEKARRIADAFDRMRHDPGNPEVRRSYEALIEETLAQYRALKDKGYDFHFMQPGEADPYAKSPSLGYLDLKRNGRLTVFPTDQGYGTLTEIKDNPLLRRVGKVGDHPNATANDAFRVVHDMFGHFGPGNPFFRAKGEERAWYNHKRMYSPEARGAMTTETRGQNSWVNYGPHAAHNKTASGTDTVYADQKVGLMPDWTQYKEGGMVNQGARARLMAHLERGGKAKKPKRPKDETVYADPNPGLNPASLKVIEARRQEMLKDKKDRLQPTGDNLFEDSTDAYRRTTDLVPQYDNADRIPAPPEGKDVPRLRPLVEHREEMARRLASEMEPGLKTTAPYFYNVGPIHERNIASGMSPEESISNLRALGPYMGATSSKTPTDQNVLNATLLRTFDTQGLPYQGGDSANLRGYNMMGSHLKSAAKYRDNGVDPMQQPKHDSYSENFSGNLMPTTTDSHDSKSTLLMMNRIEPGSVHDIYIHPKERERYREDPSSLTGDMLTGMIPGGTIDKGQGSRPYDYTPLSAVTRRTSELLGIHPAEGQSLKWFTFGDQTGLKSPPKTLVQLLNERINITAQVLGEPPEKVWKMVQAGEIPLMKKGGRVKC